MKRLIIILLFPLSFISRGQTLDQAVQGRIDSSIKKFAQTLENDTVIISSRSDAQPISDTLFIPKNSSVSMVIALQTENITTKETGRAMKYVQIKNVNGVCSISTNADFLAYSGSGTLSKAAWSVVQSGAFVVIRRVGVAGIPILWQLEVKPDNPMYL